MISFVHFYLRPHLALITADSFAGFYDSPFETEQESLTFRIGPGLLEMSPATEIDMKLYTVPLDLTSCDIATLPILVLFVPTMTCPRCTSFNLKVKVEHIEQNIQFLTLQCLLDKTSIHWIRICFHELILDYIHAFQ